MKKESNLRNGENLNNSWRMEPNGLLNEKNLNLWNQLNCSYTIELEKSPEKGYLTYFADEVVVIEVDTEDINPAAFTHELLHVLMKERGVEVIWDLKEKIQEDEDLCGLFSTSLRVHIGNCMEHIKMLPIFLELGFRNEEFLKDYNTPFCDETVMLNLERSYYKKGRPDLRKVDIYLAKFFAMKASNNPEFDYTHCFERLEKLDPNLYKLNMEFWDGWMAYQLGEPKSRYMSPLLTYLNGLKTWRRHFND